MSFIHDRAGDSSFRPGHKRWVFIRVVDGKRVKASFALREQAANAKRQWDNEQAAAPNTLDAKRFPSDYTLRRYVTEIWLPVQSAGWKQSTHDSYSSRLNVHILPSLGDLPVRDIGEAHLEVFVQKLRTGERFAPRYVTTVYKTLLSILHDAADAGARGAVTKRMSRIPVPPIADEDMVLLSPQQVWAVVGKMPADNRCMIALLASSGLRYSECAGLTRDRITVLEDGTATMRVDRQVRTQGKGGTREIAFSTPKSARSRRTVYIDAEMATELLAHIARYGLGPQGLVFHTAVGTVVGHSNINRKFQRALRETQCPSATLHDLRHFYASTLIAAGLTVAEVSAALGHSTPAVTLNTYTHLWPAQANRSAAAIASSLRGVKPRMLKAV